VADPDQASHGTDDNGTVTAAHKTGKPYRAQQVQLSFMAMVDIQTPITATHLPMTFDDRGVMEQAYLNGPRSLMRSWEGSVHIHAIRLCCAI